VDREKALRDRNWGVTITWSHSSLAALLPEDLFKRLSECQPDPTLDSKEANCENVMLRDGKTGEPMLQPPFPGIRRMNLQKTKNMWAKGLNVKVGSILFLFHCRLNCSCLCSILVHFFSLDSEARHLPKLVLMRNYAVRQAPLRHRNHSFRPHCSLRGWHV
jgi:hypothetical protein